MYFVLKSIKKIVSSPLVCKIPGLCPPLAVDPIMRQLL